MFQLMSIVGAPVFSLMVWSYDLFSGNFLTLFHQTLLHGIDTVGEHIVPQKTSQVFCTF